MPNPSGTPPYVCSPNLCIAACGGCTNNADCCPGTSCELPSGSTHGICGPCSGGTDGGMGGGGDGGGSGDGGVTIPPDAGCSLFGQVCVTGNDCCYGLPCINGRCEAPIQ